MHFDLEAVSKPRAAACSRTARLLEPRTTRLASKPRHTRAKRRAKNSFGGLSPFARVPKVLHLLFTVLVLAATGRTAFAQTAPQIGFLFPAGAQRGAKVQVQVGGKYMPAPCGIWIGGEGVRSEKETTAGTMTLVVDSDATRGPRPVRIHSIQGGSGPRPFIVGELPEVIESTDDGQTVALQTTVNGRLNPKGDIDQFRLSLHAGQQIVCSAAVKSIGSPSDTILRMLDSKGRVLETADDHASRDPLLVFRCPADGTYTLQIYDFNLAGGPDHVYRLTITDGPFLSYAFPPGIRQGVEADVTLFGWNLEDGESMKYKVTADGLHGEVRIPGCANQLTLAQGSVPELVESISSESQRIPVPVTINGRLESAGDADTFRFTATKGQKLALKAISAGLGFPADLVMEIADAERKLIREIDDIGGSRDPSYLFAAPADGDYLVTLKERALRGGPRFIYRLSIGPPEPTVRLTVKSSEFAVNTAETLSLPVRVEPLDGFSDEIQLSASGLPAGVSMKLVSHTPKKAGDVMLEIQTDAAAGFVSNSFRIEARLASEPTREPIAELGDLWLAVGPKVPFELSTVSAIQEAPRLTAFLFPVQVKRDDGFTGPIRLVGVDPDRRGTVVPMEGIIATGQAAGSIPLIIQSAAIEGTTHRCRVMGVVDLPGPNGKTHSVFHVAKGSMGMGCQPNYLTLTVEPPRIRLRAGESTRIAFRVSRRVEMKEITISLKAPLPSKGIAGKPISLGPGETTGTFELHIQAGTVLPPLVTVPFRAQSSRDGLPVYAETSATLITR